MDNRHLMITLLAGVILLPTVSAAESGEKQPLEAWGRMTALASFCGKVDAAGREQRDRMLHAMYGVSTEAEIALARKSPEFLRGQEEAVEKLAGLDKESAAAMCGADPAPN
jgi:hypothetical protein